MGSRFRIVALVLPLLVGVFDATGAVAVVAEGRRCTSDCLSGALLLPFAPTVTPLLMAGVGDEDAHPTTTGVVVAYAVVLSLLAAWWWFLGGALARLASRGPVPRREHGTSEARVSWARFLALWAAAVALTLLVKLPLLAIEAPAGLWVSLPVELAIWGLAAWVFARNGRRLLPGL